MKLGKGATQKCGFDTNVD